MVGPVAVPGDMPGPVPVAPFIVGPAAAPPVIAGPPAAVPAMLGPGTLPPAIDPAVETTVTVTSGGAACLPRSLNGNLRRLPTPGTGG